MEKCYEYQTKMGPFYIVKNLCCYYAVYAGTSIWSSTRAEEIAAVLGNGYKFSFLGSELGEIDTTNLRLASVSCFFCCAFLHPTQADGLHDSFQ